MKPRCTKGKDIQHNRNKTQSISLTSTLWGSDSIQKRLVVETQAEGMRGREEEKRQKSSVLVRRVNQPWCFSYQLIANCEETEGQPGVGTVCVVREEGVCVFSLGDCGHGGVWLRYQPNGPQTAEATHNTTISGS